MLPADNDNFPMLVIETSKDTVVQFRELRQRLDIESDAELIELALESLEHDPATTSAGRFVRKDAKLRLALPRATMAALTAGRMRSGLDYEETVRQAICSLASVAFKDTRMPSELAG